MIELGKKLNAAGEPVVFFFDEADCIPASSIVSFLRQLRDGYMPVFDADTTKSWEERIWREDKVVDGKTIHCYGV